MKAEKSITLKSKEYVLIYDWDAIRLLENKFTHEALNDVLANYNLAQLADILECGLAKNHPDLTAEKIFDMSPSIVDCRQAVEGAIALAYFGTETPDFNENGEKKKTSMKAKLLWRFVMPFILGFLIASFGILPLINLGF